MTQDDSHLSDETLLRDIDGELKRREERRVRAHLEVCWSCRTRRSELECAIADFVHVHQQRVVENLPPAEGPRALLKARIAELSRSVRWPPTPELAWSLGLLLLLMLGWASLRLDIVRGRPRSHSAIVVLPDSRLTPGATVLANRGAVCAQPDTKNKAVPAALRKQVFDEYGIAGADPSLYEVDYLVTPALGGADDIHNLWPHSYIATDWNARVKDELEDHLRDLVCQGRLDLAAAQQEIATDWIAAYKKYFRTDRPLEQYCRKCVP